MRKVTITEEEWDNWVASFEGNDYSLVVPHLEEMKKKLFPPAPQWIFDRQPTKEEGPWVAIPSKAEQDGWVSCSYEEINGWPWMSEQAAEEAYTEDNPAPNPFERDLKTQK